MKLRKSASVCKLRAGVGTMKSYRNDRVNLPEVRQILCPPPTRTLKLIPRFMLVAVIIYSINHSSVMVIVSSESPSGGQECIKIYRSRHYRNLKVQPFCSTHAQCSGVAGYLIPRCRWFNQVSIMVFVPLHDLLYSTRFFLSRPFK